MSGTAGLPDLKRDRGDLAALAVVLERVLRPLVPDREDRRDVVQEAIARTLEVRPRLADDVVGPYAMTVARNLVSGLRKRQALKRRHQARLFERPGDLDAAEELTRSERDAAVRSAIAALPESERIVLLGHVVDEHDTAQLAELVGSTPGGVAARLARARARARVDYLLALRRQHLPSSACRPVLLAISAADRRRQDALGTAEHLRLCPICPTLVPPLAERSSTLAGLVPLPLLLLVPRLRARSHVQVAVSTAAAVLVVGSVTALQVQGGSVHRQPSSQPVGARTSTRSGGSDGTIARTVVVKPAPASPRTALQATPRVGADPVTGYGAGNVATSGASARGRPGPDAGGTDAPAPDPSFRAPLPVNPTAARTVDGTVTEVEAAYGFRLLVDGSPVYVVFTGLPARQVRVGDQLTVRGTTTKLHARVLDNPADVASSQRRAVARLGTYLAAPAAGISFRPRD